MFQTNKFFADISKLSTDDLHMCIKNLDLHSYSDSVLDMVNAIISQPHCDSGSAYRVFWFYAPHHETMRFDPQRFSDKKYVLRHGIYEKVGRLAYQVFYESKKYLRDSAYRMENKYHEHNMLMVRKNLQYYFRMGVIDWKLAPFLQLLRDPVLHLLCDDREEPE